MLWPTDFGPALFQCFLIALVQCFFLHLFSAFLLHLFSAFLLHLFSALWFALFESLFVCFFFSVLLVCLHFFSAPCLFALVSVLFDCLHFALLMHILSAFQGLQGALVQSSPACTSSVRHLRTLSRVPFLCTCPVLWPAFRLQDMIMTTPRFVRLRRRRQTNQEQ